MTVGARAAQRLAWALCALSLGLTVVAVLAFWPLEAAPWPIPIGASMTIVGGPLAARRTTNPAGWLLLAWGLVISFYAFVGQYATYAMVTHPGSLPGGDWLAWAASSMWHAAFVCFVALFLLFPHGRLLSPRWRPVLWLAIVVYAGLAATGLGWSVATREHFPFARDPLVLPGRSVATAAYAVLLETNLALVLAAAVSLAVRLRRSRGDERQQVKWFIYPSMAAVTLFVISIGVVGNGSLGVFLFPVIPISTAIAITKYRLYDIDRLVSRTVSYAAISGLLVGVYLLLALVGQTLVPGRSRSQPVVAISTLVVAALFQPIRRRVQHAVDRRFNRSRYDASRAIDAFAARLREQIDLDSLRTELVGIVHQTMQPTSASLWLREPTRL